MSDTDYMVPKRALRVYIYATNDRSVSVGAIMNDANSIYCSYAGTFYDVQGTVLNVGPYSVAHSEAFHIFDVVGNKAWNYLMRVGWDNTFNLFMSWDSSSDQNPRYDSGVNGIYLNRANAWENALFLHEYGHFVENKVYGVFPPVYGCFTWSDTGSDECAWREGWATFLQGAILNSPFYGGTTCNNCNPIGRNMELPFPLAQGSGSPGANAAFLWDIFDPMGENCDSMESGFNGQINNGIWKIFYNDHPTTVHIFRSRWKTSGNGYSTQLNKLSDHHLISNYAAPCLNHYSSTYIPQLIK